MNDNGNNHNRRGSTDYMGIAAIFACIILWQLITIIQVLLVVAGVLALGFGSWWIWSKIQATKNQQHFMNTMYGNHQNMFNQNQISNQPQNHALPPTDTQQYPHLDIQPSQNFKDFEEFQQYKEFQRQKQSRNSNQQPPYNPYIENYEG